MKQSFRPAVYALLILVAGAVIWWTTRDAGQQSAMPGVATGPGQKTTAGSAPGGPAPAPAPSPRGHPLPAAQENLLQSFVEILPARNVEANRRELAGLIGQLRKLPRTEAARQLLAFLDSGADALTKLDLSVGRGGWLDAAPTLRVAALDWLAEFDPEAAYAYSRQIFAGSNSADEWALALRNYYWKTGSADGYFVARVEEAFGRENWLQNPSAGLAESLDFPVAIGGAEGLALLQGLMQKSEPLRLAALAALDAAVIGQRATMIPLLAGSAADNATLDAGSRAALLSRADIRDATQRAAIESYLASADVPQGARAEFLRQFPNQSMILADHLVTTSRPMPLEQSAQLDLAALQFVDGLIQAGTCPGLAGDLAASRERLAGFVESARRGGKL